MYEPSMLEALISWHRRLTARIKRGDHNVLRGVCDEAAARCKTVDVTRGGRSELSIIKTGQEQEQEPATFNVCSSAVISGGQMTTAL